MFFLFLSHFGGKREGQIIQLRPPLLALNEDLGQVDRRLGLGGTHFFSLVVAKMRKDMYGSVCMDHSVKRAKRLAGFEMMARSLDDVTGDTCG